MERAGVAPRPNRSSRALDDPLVRLDLAGTVAFAVTAGAATISLDVFQAPAVVVALVLFFAGCVVFLMAFMRAVERSRYEAIGIGGLYFLSGAAPAAVRRWFLALLGVQVAVAVTTASIQVFTSLAFGVLVPMWGLGLAGLWGSRHGRFTPRAPDHKRPARGNRP